jgi:hypothetical protein
MGAAFITMTAKGDPEKAFAKRRKKDLHDYGHGGYTGSFAEIESVIIKQDEYFHCIHDAEEHLEANCEKWEPAIAVMYHDAEDKEMWLIGAISPE